MKLSTWKKYLIWIYTLDSNTINNYLKGKVNNKSIKNWCMFFIEKYKDVIIDRGEFMPLQYKNNFANNEYEEILKKYCNELKNIIDNSPPLSGDIILYKASSRYHDLKIGKVFQKQFNSCSYRIDFDFSLFLDLNDFCCMHKITVRKNSKILILSSALSAFPDEYEVLLPFNIDFNITSKSTMILNMPRNLKDSTYIQIQTQPFTIGQVYAYNYKKECNTIAQKVELYNSILSA